MTWVGTCPDCGRRIVVASPKHGGTLCRHGSSNYRTTPPCPGSGTHPLDGTVIYQQGGRPTTQPKETR